MAVWPKVYGSWSVYVHTVCNTQYTDKWCIVYGHWYTVHDFDSEPYAMVTLNYSIPWDL